MVVSVRCFKRVLMVCIAAVLVSLQGCATWSTATVKSGDDVAPVSVKPSTSPAAIVVTEGDISDRPYVVLGDITATVNKTTIFNADPTPDMVAVKLQEEAAKLGADAVVLVRFGKVGMSLFSYGSLEGKGRAIKFTQ